MEILAPVGTPDMLQAAIENGADAIYFGVQSFNARMRANNFLIDDLSGMMDRLHERGMKGYLTFNVLIFEEELERAKDLLLAASRAGVDAIIVQDLGLAWLARRLVPDLPVHGSTQMTISSAEAIGALEMLGIDCERVVLARELNLREIERVARATQVELEVFIHGALCVAYSGQCLTSEALGGRSANRGECAQACRLPYDMMVDGKAFDLGERRFLVSPKDLAGYEDVPRLLELGVKTLKIEGRLKSPEYVAATVQAYREAVDNAEADSNVPLRGDTLAKLENSFSRGFTGGYLHENNHQVVVDGETSSKIGPLVGSIVDVTPDSVRVRVTAALKPGDGILFEGSGEKRGGRIYEVRQGRNANEQILLFGNGQIITSRLISGGKVWKTSDPQIEKSLKSSFEGEKLRFQRPIGLQVEAHLGRPLVVQAFDGSLPAITLEDSAPVELAERRPLDVEVLREQLGRLGGTPFRLEELIYQSDCHAMVPVSRLNAMRRALVELLLKQRREAAGSRVENPRALADRRSAIRDMTSPVSSVPVLSVLCRSLEQVEAASGLELGTIYTDFEDQKLHEEARRIVRNQRFAPATIRVMKPGEDAMLRRIMKASPDAILVRNLAAWKVLSSAGVDVPFIGDYSLNISNSLTASLHRDAGFSLLTPSYDLNSEELDALLRNAPPGWFEVTAHQRIPMFHMEHCVFCRFLSSGTNASNCGRPCEKHSVTLRDRMGYEHPLKADYGCRNTLFNAVSQSAAEYIPGLLRSGVRAFRLDLLNESAVETERLVSLYRRTVHLEIEPRTVWQELRATSKLGVTRGSMDHALAQLPRKKVAASSAGTVIAGER